MTNTTWTVSLAVGWLIVLTSTRAGAQNATIVVDKNALPFCDDVERNRTAPAEVRAAPVVQGDSTPAQAGAPDLDTRRALEETREEMKLLRSEVEALKQEQKDQSSWLDKLKPLSGRFSGFIDFGGFFVQGDGSGLRMDTGHKLFPKYSYVPQTWVFYGDPLGTQINARGDPADTGPSRAVKINDIGNRGKATFIVNSINFAIFAGLGDNLTLNASVDFLPRARNASQPGVSFNDFVDIRYAYGEFIAPTKSFALSIYAGKFDPVFGMEYRSQDAPDRLTVTPSLICRYTCGRPTGLKARARFFDERFIVALSVTNGPSFTEYFPFGNEIAYQNLKTAQARVSVVLPVGSGWEIGASGSGGAESFQTLSSVLHWQLGIDTRLNIRGFEFSAEFLKGRANGKTNPGSTTPYDAAPFLDYVGAYGLAGYHVTNWFEPYVRSDWRQATHLDGSNFAYVTRELRVTGGLRFEIGQYLIIKAEYTHTFELNLPQFPSDVATGSLVLRY